MNYIVFDLEFNQKHPDEIIENDNLKGLTFEILQIGALKLDQDLNTVSTFNSFVKPTVYKTLHPYVVEITNITDEKLAFASDFTNVYNDFVNFIGDTNSTFVLWGITDIKELIRNANFYNLSIANLPKNYIDIQGYTSKHFNYSKGMKIGLKNAIEKLELPVDGGEFHDAYNDAYYTAEVFKRINDTTIKPKPYILSNNKRKKLKKQKLNTQALISQFEKMYNRKLNKEEQSMITLAYNMGRTNQFTEGGEKSND